MSPPYRRPSAALVVAFLALLVALSGTSFASDVTAAATHLITGKQIKNGSLQVKDLSKKARKSLKGNRGKTGPRGLQGIQGVKGDQGIPGPTSGATMNATTTQITGCGDSTLASRTLTLTRPAQILASAGGAWARDSTNLNTGTISVQLLKDGTPVASTPQGFASSFSAGTQRIGMSVTGVMFTGSNPFPNADAPAYVAQPGTYTLRLQGGASDGGCTGTSTLWRGWMTYVLLGTSQ